MEADEVGLLLAAKACFDVREAPAFWALMEMSETEEEKMPFEILSTHPTLKNREGKLASMVPKAIEVRSSCGCYKLSSRDPYEEFKKYAQKVAQIKETAVKPKLSRGSHICQIASSNRANSCSCFICKF